MPRKSKAKRIESPATDPTPVSEILEKSPAVAQILASRDARAEIEPDQPMAEHEAVAAFQRQREREQRPSMEALVTEALVESQKSHAQRLTGLRPAPAGFVGLEGHYAAGIRLTRSLDKSAVGIQFADDHRPSTDGLNPEKQRLNDRGFSYKPERAQWERRDREQPAENYQDAKAFVASLVKERLAEPSTEVGRS